ncbi:hypothetical protein [Rhizobium rhizogenes]|uniref:hypothetical protein n=1 Tax=Rhizobium rhizogenes TaxID=359 RepID=UPI0022C39915|nr:hypothetical protein [Rhizobium rhizogenes]MCZ7465995.1 hypothetical protein [Rhizobium rhizogenes]
MAQQTLQFRLGNGADRNAKRPLKTFFRKKSSFFEVFLAAFSWRPNLKHPSQNGKSAPPPGFS